MPADTLAVTLIQPHMAWEDKAANVAHYEDLIRRIEGRKEVVVLPEMFSTGFSMDAPRLAEAMNGDTVAWMRETARQYRIILTGSVIIEEDGRYFNRLIWMQPDGRHHHYDKRHLFSLAGEEKVYSAGERRVIVSVKGFRVNLQVCYDLRFPVWSRQQGGDEFDLLLYVANWPERRSLAWKTLLQARAIENQCYCVGVNRVGEDGNGHFYSGDSAVISPIGEVLWQQGVGVEAVQTVLLERQAIADVREKLPFWKDGDAFMLM